MSPSTMRRLAPFVAAAIGIIAVTLAQFPQAQALHAERARYYPEKAFTGALTTGAEDTTTYWGWMEEARAGHFLFADPYTPETTPRNYVNLFFWGLGTVSRVTGRSVPVVYAASRPVLGAAVLVLLWIFLGRLFDRPLERLGAFVLALFPGGWEGIACYMERNHGWGHVTSPGWWIPEMNTFFSLMTFPHFLAGFALMLVVAIVLLDAWRDEQRWKTGGIDAGLVLALLTFVHPYDTVSMLGVAWSAPVAFWLAERKLPRRAIATTLIATAVWMPALIYNWLVFRGNPAMRAWDLQNVMDTPHWDRLVVAFGISGLLAVAALAGLRKMSRAHLAMAAWLLSTFVLIAMPIRFQRRMLGGVQFPIAALAIFALATWVVPALVRALRAAGPREATGGAVLVAALAVTAVQGFTPYYLLDIEKKSVRNVSYPSWLERPEREALDFLRDRTPGDARVLSSYDLGNYVPALAARQCVLGHYGLTIDAETKREEVATFFDPGTADDRRRALLDKYGARWLVWSAHERALGAWTPAGTPWLREAFHAGDGATRTVVYEVTTATASR